MDGSGEFCQRPSLLVESFPEDRKGGPVLASSSDFLAPFLLLFFGRCGTMFQMTGVAYDIWAAIGALSLLFGFSTLQACIKPSLLFSGDATIVGNNDTASTHALSCGRK